MRVGVPRETMPGERRVALVPESVSKLVKAGHEVIVEAGAGVSASFVDRAYLDAGATLAPSGPGVYDHTDVIVKVQRPTAEEAASFRSGMVLISLLPPAASADLIAQLGERGVVALALERVPRITRAQSMDVLSSQATVAGYKAVLLGAATLGKFLPMLTTAAGNIVPSKVFVIGAGVAGLMAIATARRLGGIVSAFDVRAAVKEQVQSLGASFLAPELVSAEAEDKGGYAREQSEDQQKRIHQVIRGHVKDIDLVITTAQIPGKPAPMLLPNETLSEMRPGAVIVDLAAESGGNCAGTRAGETVQVGGVTIMGPTNIPATVPVHASQMFSRNVLTFLQHLAKSGSLSLDPADEITGPMWVTPKPAAAVAG
jgi:H+-translocating NAD(P) transhydrogenase subunit alpha